MHPSTQCYYRYVRSPYIYTAYIYFFATPVFSDPSLLHYCIMTTLYSIPPSTTLISILFISYPYNLSVPQLKIFSTAAFAVILLGRNITPAKWRALLLLVLGCILVASPTFNKPIDCEVEYFNKMKGTTQHYKSQQEYHFF